MKKAMNPRFMLIASMTIFGTLGLFVRNIPISSGELALYRAVLAAVLIAVFLLVTKQKIPFENIKKEVPLLLVSGIAMGINWILLFEAYKYTTVSVATLSYYFAPVIVTIVCPILFKEKLTGKQIVCFLMSTLGLILITGIGDVGGGSDFIGILFGLGAAVFYATVVLLNKFIKNVEDIHRTFLQFLSAIVILIPYVIMTSGVTLGNLGSVGWVNLLIVGFVHTGVTYCMYFSSLKELPGQKAAILSYIDPFVAVLISVTVLGETMTLQQVIGGILILGFTLWNEISPKPGGRRKYMSVIRNWFLNEKKETKILLRCIPATVVTLFVVSVICMNLLANKTLLQLDWIALDGGILISWLSFMCMDIVTKHFGPKASNKISVLAAMINLLTCLIFFVASVIPSNAADYSAFDGIFGGTWFILLGSTVAFLSSACINNMLNWLIGKAFKKNPDGKIAYAAQTYISTFIGQFFDNFIFSVIVFIGFAPIFWHGFHWTLLQCIMCALTGAVAELIMEIAFSPIGYRIVMRWKQNNIGKEYTNYIDKGRK